MQEEYCLSELLPHQQATVMKIRSGEPMKRRLQDLGFTRGSTVECCFSASAGDPVAYYVGETLLALRKQDADKILVTKRKAST